MDPDAIYRVLLAHATSSASLFAPTPTPIGTPDSERIYAALLANAASLSSSAAAVASAPTTEHVLLATTSTTPPLTPTGFLSSRLSNFSSPIPILLGVLVLLLGVFVATAGSRSFSWAKDWGKIRGTTDGKAHIPGGIGGGVIGAIFSSTFAALATLLVLSRESTPALGSWGTLAILVTTAIPGAFLGARLSLTLLLTATFKLQTSFPRQIILAITVPLSLILALLPQTRRSLSIFSGLTGAFLIVLGIDLLVHKDAFVDLLGLLVSSHGVAVGGTSEIVVVKWGEGSAKGLVAAWWIVGVVSSAWQWWWYEGAVVESWNAYLSSFVSSRPSALGSFTPEPSLLSRLLSPFTRRSSSSPLTSLPKTRRRSPWDEDDLDSSEKGGDWDDDADTLAGASSSSSSKPAKYGAANLDDDEEQEKGFRPLEYKNRMERVESRMSGSTLWGDGGGAAAEKKAMMSDDEDEEDEDANLPSLPFSSSTPASPHNNNHSNPSKKIAGSIKGFFSGSSTTSTPARYPTTTTQSFPPPPPSPSERPLCRPSQHHPTTNTPPPPNAVPATQSLIHALHRVNAAQKQARGELPLSTPTTTATIQEGEEGRRERLAEEPRQRHPSWDDWWKEVVDKSEKK
ncbi:hypothetical protein RQP46_003760 [Phenoliferia psychrophenolica]